MQFDTNRVTQEAGQRVRGAVEDVAGEVEQFRVDARDFLSARERGGTAGTVIEQRDASLAEAAEIVNRSFPGQTDPGSS
jgi:hypothetical protein